MLALAAAGCGGDDAEPSEEPSDESSEESSEGSSDEEFADEFDEVCESFADELADIQTRFGELESDDYQGAAELTVEAGEVLADGIDELEEIEVPDDLQDEVDELLELLDDRVELGEDLAEALEDEDDEAIGEIVDEGDGLDEDLDSISEELGVECYRNDDESDSSDDFSDSSDDFSDSSDDFSDDFSDSSDDFSDDSSDEAELGEPMSPGEVIPEYGTVDRDARFDGLADSCYAGDLGDCDRLYQLTPPSDSIFSYEGYGATCGGRLPNEDPGNCEARG